MLQFTLKRRITALFLLLGLAAAGWGLAPTPALPSPALVTLAPGSSRWRIGRQLAAAGVVRSALALEAWSLLHRHQTLKAGTYQFAGGQWLPAVYAMLARGQFFQLALVVPEGYNRFDIARALAQQHLADPAAFLAATTDPSPVRDLDPAAVSLEGYLFPATYRIAPHTPVAAIVALMTARFRLELKHESVLLHPLPSDLHRWLTIASMVEKESALPAERARMAGVFANRLARGLPLQCDPTVIYAALLAHRYQGSLHRADLEFASPYNTYRQPGLPPGPIANPGRASLLAAADPAPTDDLYFVSDGHGGHRFARTLAQQQKNVALYLRALRRK